MSSVAMLKSIVGDDVRDDLLQSLLARNNNNIDAAANAFFDEFAPGTAPATAPPTHQPTYARSSTGSLAPPPYERPSAPAPAPSPPASPRFSNLESLLEWSAAHYQPTPAAAATPATASDDEWVSVEHASVAELPPSQLELLKQGNLTLATFTPPQTLESASTVPPTRGAHCLVVDVSFSMEAAATVTTTDGDKVDHGFTVLDIAKHAMCTYVSSLGDDDWVCVACYASDARVVIEWTRTDADGKAALFAAIGSLKEEGSTNLTAGIATGMRAFESLPGPVAERPSDYALLLAVATDGQPSSGTHPPGGPTGYAAYRDYLAASVSAKHGAAAVPALVAIGLGNELDSRMLASWSDTFLHIPDPGSVGPFMVNLLGATRATARLPVAANRGTLRLSPASAVGAVPGYRTTLVGVGDAAEVHVPLGAITFDQPRHVLIVGADGAAAAPLSATLSVGDAAVATAAGPPRAVATAADAALFGGELKRTAAACALQLCEDRLSIVDELGAPVNEVAARLKREGGRFGDVTISLLWNDQADLDLHVTLPSGEEINYRNKRATDLGPDGKPAAELDVDMNAGAPYSKEPVENVYAGDAEAGVEAPRGKYVVQVHNFGYHSDEGLAAPRDVEFKVSVRMHGDSTEYTGVCTRAKQMVTVCEFDYGGRLEGATDEAAEALRRESARAAREKERLRGVPKTLLQKLIALLPAADDGVGPAGLRQTLADEALLAVHPDKFRTWGRHYLVTLPQMLLAQRRSNFRDAALQSFGRDASGREACFERLAADAELAFAQLKPPDPSGLERLARQRAAADRAAAAPRATYTAMPDEFMRGGGCFAPDALVSVVDAADGAERLLPIAELRAGQLVRTGSGGTAAVRCVVVSPTADGEEAVFTRLPSGLQLTEWHPLLDASGRWRFPHMLGERVARRGVPAVYNLVLTREHVAMVGGYACATLGHGIVGPVVGHPFWGTARVLDELATHEEGWAAGRVVLAEPLRAGR